MGVNEKQTMAEKHKQITGKCVATFLEFYRSHCVQVVNSTECLVLHEKLASIYVFLYPHLL
jgi:hypothetical protein